MSIQANFNKLVYLKKFNNYFNRKIYGGSSLEDYFNGESGVSYTKTKTFGKNNISDFSDGDLTYVIFKSTILDLPIGIEIINNSISVENDGGYITSSGDLTYFKDKRIVEILFGHTASSVSDFPDNIKITLEYTYINREYKREYNKTKNFKKQGIVPYWLEHPEVCKSEPLNEEEQKELDELLKEIQENISHIN